MKLTSDDETLAENKVLILYILNKVGKSISNDALLNLVLAVTDMNYFYFQQFLLDLIHDGYVVSYIKEEEQVYSITEEGKKALDLTEDIVPGIMKLKIDSKLKPVLDNIEDSSSIVAEYTPRSENDYIVTCKIIENNQTIFEVQTFAGSPEKAKAIAENWKEHASEIYPKMMELLDSKN